MDGKSGIFRHGGCTLELTYSQPYIPFSERQKEGFKEDKRILNIIQYRGYSNVEAPIELTNEVKRLLDLFNENIKEYEDLDKLMGHRAQIDILFPMGGAVADLPF